MDSGNSVPLLVLSAKRALSDWHDRACIPWRFLDLECDCFLLFAVMHCTTLNKVHASDAVLAAEFAYHRM